MNNNLKERFIELVFIKGYNLKMVQNTFGITESALYDFLYKNNLSYKKLVEKRNNQILKEVKFIGYRKVSEKYNISIEDIKKLENKIKTKKKQLNSKYFTNSWAYKDWIGLHYNT